MAFESNDTGELSDVRRDEVIWREFALAGWPRSCPDYFDDDEVSGYLHMVRDTQSLPWEVEDGDLTWKEMR